MFIMTMRPGESAAVDNIAIDVGELMADRVRVSVTAPESSRITLVPEGVVLPARITVWRRRLEQIHVGDGVQIWVVQLGQNRVRIGFEAPRDCQIRKTSFTIDDDASAEVL